MTVNGIKFSMLLYKTTDKRQRDLFVLVPEVPPRRIRCDLHPLYDIPILYLERWVEVTSRSAETERVFTCHI